MKTRGSCRWNKTYVLSEQKGDSDMMIAACVGVVAVLIVGVVMMRAKGA